MPGIGNFYGKPIGAMPNDIALGEIDGSPIYRTPGGVRYYEQYQPVPPMVPAEALTTTLDSQGRGIHTRAPQEMPAAYDMVGAVAGEALQGLTAPGRALQGEPVTYGDAWATTLDYGVLSAPTSAPEGSLRIFAGRNAKTADLDALAQAERMTAEGVDRGDIWRDTGWYRGVDDQWRFEIDDSAARLSDRALARYDNPDMVGSSRRIPPMETNLDGAFVHPELKTAYEDMWNDVTMRDMASTGGSYNPETGAITVKGPDEGQIRKAMLHELQHDVQGREGFTAGSNPLAFMGSKDPMDLYRRTAGEVEAYNVINRADMTPAQRRATPPWETMDVPEIAQIVRKGDGGADYFAMSAPEGALRGGGIRAYHGSPHDFDRFSMDKIGTGEGAQAYGHGLYFAESEDVARGYRDALSNGWRLDVRDPLRNAGLEGRDLDVASQMLSISNDGKSAARDWENWLGKELSPEQRAAFEAAYASKGGHMYEVNINADPDDFLDWDAPLSEQPRAMSAIERLRRSDDTMLRLKANAWSQFPPNTGEQFLRELSDLAEGGSGKFTAKTSVGGSETLREAGIPGIKYKDGFSRGAEGGTRNYVVFDESLIEIVRKYGIAGAAAYLGMPEDELQQRMGDM